MRILIAGEGTEEIALSTESISYVKFYQMGESYWSVDIGLKGIGVVNIKYSSEERAYNTYMRLNSYIKEE